MSRRMLMLLVPLFFFSGATSLVYETLWIRVLSLGVGSTSSSMSMVLSIFFFGLSLGAYYGGRWIHRVRHPILTYGILEGIIGVYSLFVIFPLLHFHKVMGILPLTGSFSWFGIFSKFFLVFLFLIFPSFCMGATLPILVKLFTREESNHGKRISFLYGLNTLGAVAGAMSTSFFLIPQFGVLKANTLTAGLNILIFGICYLVHKKNALSTLTEKIATPINFAKRTLTQNFVLIACGICGYSSISAQVIWNKYLGIFFGTNIYGLGIILSLFLIGIALGSLLLSLFIEHIQNRIRFFTVLLGLSVVSVLTTTHLLNSAPLFTNVIGYYLGQSTSLLMIKSILSALILLPSTLIFGALLPLGIRILAEKAEEAPHITGVAYSINTVGSILGAYLTGIFFVPSFGSSIALQIALLLLILTVLMMGFRETLFSARKRVFSVAASALLLALTFQFSYLDFTNIIKSAYHQATDKEMSLSEVMKYFSNNYEDFIFIHEGKTAITSLSYDPQDGDNNDILRLKTNGLNESYYDMGPYTKSVPKYEGMLAFLPYILAPNPTSAFVVGFGGGFTVDVFTRLPLEQVHVVELEEGIIDAAQKAYNGNNPVLKRKNLELEINDARFVLAAQMGGPYDVVVSQPSHSWLSGVANLFTLEFFEIVKKNLSNQGVFAQWLNLYNMDEESMKSIFNTFYTVFPHGFIVTDYHDDELIMVGSMKPIEIDLDRIQKFSNQSEFSSLLEQLPMDSPASFLTNFSLSRDKILSLTKGSPLNTDINAYAEVRQSQIFYSPDINQLLPQEFLSQNFSADMTDLIKKDGGSSQEFLTKLFESYEHHEKYDKLFAYLKVLEKSNPNETLIGTHCFHVERYECAKNHLQKAMKTSPNASTLNLLIATLNEMSEHSEVKKTVRKYKKWKDSNTECHLIDAAVRSQQISPSMARILSKKRGDLQEQCGSFIDKVLVRFDFHKKNYTGVIEALEPGLEDNSLDLESLQLLLSSYSLTKQQDQVYSILETTREAFEQESQRLQDLSQYLLSYGWESDEKHIQRKLSIIGF